MVINNSTSGKLVKFELQGLEISEKLSGEQSIETAYGHSRESGYWQPLINLVSDPNNNFSVRLPTESVTTFVGQIKK